MTATTTAAEDTARAERVRNAFGELLTLANLLGAQLPTERYQVTRRVLAARLAAVNALLVEAGAPVLLTRIGAPDVEWGATGTTPGTVVPASSREAIARGRRDGCERVTLGEGGRRRGAAGAPSSAREGGARDVHADARDRTADCDCTTSHADLPLSGPIAGIGAKRTRVPRG